MQYLSRICGVFFIVLMGLGCDNEAPVSSDLFEDEPAVLAKQQERAAFASFQAAGPAGARGVLAEGATFPPTKGGFLILHRGNDWISYNVHTTGLPQGAYTNWWIIFNDPSQCAISNECTLDDVFAMPAPSRPSVFWAAPGIVQSNGVGNFWAKISEGQASGGVEPFLIGMGLEDAANAAVFVIIKYHGPASNDPGELFLQTHSVVGLCDDRANALPDGNCFDPQIAMQNP